ncbi:hypothetical protein KBZ21_41140, partial [Streptomyces sp. A73]|nr:hypothetical protein [Streptomyces sp. A73]
PEWTEIRDVLVADKLADKGVSRPTIQRVRDVIERDEPALAALVFAVWLRLQWYVLISDGLMIAGSLFLIYLLVAAQFG